jgi:hypothetical protein|tara:strand:+ start:232 stop:507 length:276 start_codon:yes stop_codon:yes gene_type:complete
MAMQQSRLERENLEAHVDQCALRYRVLEEKLDRIEEKFERVEKALQEMANKQVTDSKSNNKVLIGAAATVIAGLLSTIVLLLLNFNFTPAG